MFATCVSRANGGVPSGDSGLKVHSGHDPRLVGWAQRYLLAREGSRINVACAYSLYADYARGTNHPVMTQTGFGAGLAGLAAGSGGGRDGDCVTGLCWRENAARLFPPGTEPAILISRTEVEIARIRMGGNGPDPVVTFLADRLVEAPGMVVTVEAVKQACLAEDLPIRDVLAGARARGATIRKNAWGPDFVSDCQLVGGAA